MCESKCSIIIQFFQKQKVAIQKKKIGVNLCSTFNLLLFYQSWL